MITAYQYTAHITIAIIIKFDSAQVHVICAMNPSSQVSPVFIILPIRSLKILRMKWIKKGQKNCACQKITKAVSLLTRPAASGLAFLRWFASATALPPFHKIWIVELVNVPTFVSEGWATNSKHHLRYSTTFVKLFRVLHILWGLYEAYLPCT